MFLVKRFLIGFFLLVSLVISQAFGKDFDDSCVGLDKVDRVYGANPVVTYLIMALAPEKMVGWNFSPPEQAKGIFPDESFTRPIIGGWFGQGKSANLESLLEASPDLIVVSDVTVNLESQKVLQKINLPVCAVKLDKLEEYPLAIRKIGKWLGKETKAESFAQIAEKYLARQDKRLEVLADKLQLKSVYYAQSPSGLETECRGSIHSEVVPLAGGLNPHKCAIGDVEENRFGKVKISFEQLLLYNPDAIVTQDARFYKKVYQDAKWQSLKAVQNNQVFFMPQAPFRWMDRPPSYMRLLAMQVLMEKLYPAEFEYEVEESVLEFFDVVFDKQLSDKDLAELL